MSLKYCNFHLLAGTQLTMQYHFNVQEINGRRAMEKKKTNTKQKTAMLSGNHHHKINEWDILISQFYLTAPLQIQITVVIKYNKEISPLPYYWFFGHTHRPNSTAYLVRFLKLNISFSIITLLNLNKKRPLPGIIMNRSLGRFLLSSFERSFQGPHFKTWVAAPQQ